MIALSISGAIVTIVGTIASVYSAIIAKKQAKNACTAASIAKQAQKNITNHRVTSDLSRLKESVERMISDMKIYGPGAIEEMFKCANHSWNASRLQDFIIKLEEHIDSFPNNIGDQINYVSRDLKQLLKEFNTRKTTNEIRKKKGAAILAKLSYFNSILKAHLNKNIEKEINS